MVSAQGWCGRQRAWGGGAALHAGWRGCKCMRGRPLLQPAKPSLGPLAPCFSPCAGTQTRPPNGRWTTRRSLRGLSGRFPRRPALWTQPCWWVDSVTVGATLRGLSRRSPRRLALWTQPCWWAGMATVGAAPCLPDAKAVWRTVKGGGPIHSWQQGGGRGAAACRLGQQTRGVPLSCHPKTNRWDRLGCPSLPYCTCCAAPARWSTLLLWSFPARLAWATFRRW